MKNLLQGESMRIRKLLLIHPKRSIRGLIRKYLFSELSDIEIFEAENGCKALEQMVSRSFDVVVSTDGLKDLSAIELKTRQLCIAANARTPFIIISEDESDQSLDELIQQGFDHVVQIRIRPSDLIYKINKLCNPREWRRDTRYHIPGMAVTLDLRHIKVEAFPINISRGGILVEMAIERPEHLMMSPVHISLRLPPAKGIADIEGLIAKVLRLESIRWKSDLSPAAMRATFVFCELAHAQCRELEVFLQMGRVDTISAREVEA
jgi:DNA-binding response OmpR family regulator